MKTLTFVVLYTIIFAMVRPIVSKLFRKADTADQVE